MTASAIKIENATTKDIEAIAAVLHASFAEFKSLYTPVAFQATTPTAGQLLERWEEGRELCHIPSTQAAFPEHHAIFNSCVSFI